MEYTVKHYKNLYTVVLPSPILVKIWLSVASRKSLLAVADEISLKWRIYSFLEKVCVFRSDSATLFGQTVPL